MKTLNLSFTAFDCAMQRKAADSRRIRMI